MLTDIVRFDAGVPSLVEIRWTPGDKDLVVTIKCESKYTAAVLFDDLRERVARDGTLYLKIGEGRA